MPDTALPPPTSLAQEKSDLSLGAGRPTSPSTILATTVFRHAVACAVAGGLTMPKAAYVAFGRGTAPPSPNDERLCDEVYRTTLLSAEPNGPYLLLTAVLDGAMSGDAVVTEYGFFTADGLLMGREVWKPKELEPNTQIELRSSFYF